MRCIGFLVLAAIATLAPIAADAACNPATCNAFFQCGSRECIGSTCEAFPDPQGTVCRAAVGPCDRTEVCNGSALTCPSDTKRGTTSVCRAAVDECDAAETCNGVSNTCDAPDVGIAPELARISIVDSGSRTSSGIPNPNRFFDVRISGFDLCEATVDGAPFDHPLELSSDPSGTEMGTTLVYGANNPDAFPSATYAFDINRGALTGSLDYVAIDPDGPVEIPSPAFNATLGGDPTFTVSNQCENCGVEALRLIEDITVETLGTIETSLPIDTPVEFRVGDFSKALVPLPESRYVFEAEAIAGAVVEETFALDSFTYLSGRSIRTRLAFDVPEPGPAGAGAVVLLALLGVGRLRGAAEYRAGRWRRRGRAARIGSALDLRLRELRAGRGALGAAARGRARLAPAEDARPALPSGPRARSRRIEGRAAPACMARRRRHRELAEPDGEPRAARGRRSRRKPDHDPHRRTAWLPLRRSRACARRRPGGRRTRGH